MSCRKALGVAEDMKKKYGERDLEYKYSFAEGEVLSPPLDMPKGADKIDGGPHERKIESSDR